MMMAADYVFRWFFRLLNVVDLKTNRKIAYLSVKTYKICNLRLARFDKSVLLFLKSSRSGGNHCGWESRSIL